jgi:hypothetical protein
MTCCGQRPTIPPGAPATPATAIKVTASGYGAPTGRPGPGAQTVAIRYLRTSPIVVRGVITGRRYAFSGGSPVQAVDARDAPPLLRSGLFR